MSETTPVPTRPLLVESKPLDWFKPDERELARHDDPEKILLTGQNMLANGQLQAVGATEDGRMIFGHQRWLAAKAVGIKTLEVKIFPASLTDTQFRLIRAAENLQRKDLTGHQKWLVCADLMRGNPTWQMKDLAAALNLCPSMVTRLLSPSRCSPAWLEALKNEKVGISECYAASKLSEQEQAGLLALKFSGASRDEIERAGRKTRNGTSAEVVRMSRVNIELHGGAKITVTGKEIGMAEVVDLLASTLKEARAAADKFDVKTFQSMMRDKAKVGGST